MKQGYYGAIESLTTDNTDFRRVLYTGAHLQLVLMTLQPGEAIGAETHDGHDQFFRFESGTGTVTIDETEYEVSDGDAVIVPAGALHNVTNTSASDVLTFYTIYAPPEHQKDVVHATKEVAEADEEHFDGVTSE